MEVVEVEFSEGKGLLLHLLSSLLGLCYVLQTLTILIPTARTRSLNQNFNNRDGIRKAILGMISLRSGNDNIVMNLGEIGLNGKIR